MTGLIKDQDKSAYRGENWTTCRWTCSRLELQADLKVLPTTAFSYYTGKDWWMWMSLLGPEPGSQYRLHNWKKLCSGCTFCNSWETCRSCYNSIVSTVFFWVCLVWVGCQDYRRNLPTLQDPITSRARNKTLTQSKHAGRYILKLFDIRVKTTNHCKSRQDSAHVL